LEQPQATQQQIAPSAYLDSLSRQITAMLGAFAELQKGLYAVRDACAHLERLNADAQAAKAAQVIPPINPPDPAPSPAP